MEKEVRKIQDSTKKGGEREGQNILFVWLIAGHGIEVNGQQMFVLNEFDKKSGFNKLYPIEGKIRSFSSKFGNSFHLLLAACCRESHDTVKHSGCFEGPYPKALETLNNRLKDEEAAA